MRGGILFFGGRVRGRSGRRDGAAGGTERQAGGGPVSGACAANPRSRRVYEPPGARKFFPK